MTKLIIAAGAMAITAIVAGAWLGLAARVAVWVYGG